jgi:iron complex outermembrane recepter protein
VALLVPSDQVRGAHTRGVRGDLTADVALSRILSGTGFGVFKYSSGAVGIAREEKHANIIRPVELAQVAPARAAAGIESVVVTSSKIKGDIQTVPIAITALSQEQLTSRQIAGGPDLVKEVPNLTFSKTNFTGYNIEIRGIGTQAISVTTDPAVAVAFNDIPFIRNHFFEQEFYDVSQVEVLRGPQGTLYGRNATAGVVNVISARPTDQFEAMLSADWGNYHNRRYEGMVNIPIVDDRLDLRVAGEWTKRDGYSFNTITNQPVDGRDLWSSRVSLRWRPSSEVDANLVWEHFQEDDGRMRTAKQLCKTAFPPASVGGVPVDLNNAGGTSAPADYLSQGCEMTSLYSAEAFQVPYGPSLPYYSGLTDTGLPIRSHFDVYASTTQSTNLRDIQTQINPIYKAKSDTVELNVDYNVTPSLTFTSQTGYNNDFLWSTEDYNRFDTAPGVFLYVRPNFHVANLAIVPDPDGVYRCSQGGFGDCAGLQPDAICTPSAPGGDAICAHEGMFCDPQLGCSDRLIAQDLSDERAWQASQELRLASHFAGPLNFSAGGNYLHYETAEDYYVFINTLTLFSLDESQSEGSWVPGVTSNSSCLPGGFRHPNPSIPQFLLTDCQYIDPNPITSLNGQGHNYFHSENPYVLNSYAAFGEAYYDITPDLKLTGGLRWTDDRKHFLEIPSEVVLPGYGYAVTNVVNQGWSQFTGRSVLDWTPKLDFTDQTLVYGSYAHGYKAGGANPPGAIFPITCEANCNNQTVNPIHPLTFKPEFVEAFELGSKNTLLDGALTLNGDVFYYVYKNYQISRIVDRTAINDNFNAHVRGAELETNWEAAPGLKFSFAGGFEDATLDKGDRSVDLIDRTAGNPNWIVVRPFVTEASNCILPTYVVAALLSQSNQMSAACDTAYTSHRDPVTNGIYGASWAGAADPSNNLVPGQSYYAIPGLFGAQYYGYPVTVGGMSYPGFDSVSPAAANNGAGPVPNNGQGFDKNLSGNLLPNAPHFTASLTAEYTLPVSQDWAATLHADFYWQSQQWARVFNDPIDKIRPYSTTNLALILTSASGWQVMGYVKNVFNVTSITGTFLNSDDTGLTTNVFLTDPRLFGVRVTKNW